MKRREFFRWLAAATGVALIDPGRALASSSDDLLHHDLWVWLDPRAGMHMVHFDVMPDRPTVLVVAQREENFATQIAGFRSFAGPEEVLVESMSRLGLSTSDPVHVGLIMVTQTHDLGAFGCAPYWKPMIDVPFGTHFDAFERGGLP